MLLYKDIRSKLPWHKTKKWAKRKVEKIKYIVVHTTGGTNQNPFETNKYHIGPNHISKTGAPRLCYSDYIAPYKDLFNNSQYIVYRCNNYTDSTWHSGPFMNILSVGVVLAYDGEHVAPCNEQYGIAVEHVARLCIKFNVSIKNVIGHREVPWYLSLIGYKGTKYSGVCPGKYFDCVKFRGDVKSKIEDLIINNSHLICTYLDDDDKDIVLEGTDTILV